MDEKGSRLRGKGLEIGAYMESSLRSEGLDTAEKVDSEQSGEMPGDNRTKYNHPEVFGQLNVTPVESSKEPEIVVYEFPGIGVLSLSRIDDWGEDKRVLQVEIAEVDDDKRGQGYGTDMYRYVANHLPPGYQGILSGTITHDGVRHIYETIGKDPGFLLHRLGSGSRPSLYLLELAE